MIREVEALAEMDYSLLTERRRQRAAGRRAAASRAHAGKNLLDGEELPPKARGTLAKGQRLRIETPGGGGYG